MTKTQFHQNDANCGNVLYIFRMVNVSSYMYRCMHKYKHLFGNVLWLLRRSSVHELYLFGVVELNCFSNRPVWNVFLLSSCCLDFSTLNPKKIRPWKRYWVCNKFRALWNLASFWWHFSQQLSKWPRMLALRGSQWWLPSTQWDHYLDATSTEPGLCREEKSPGGFFLVFFGMFILLEPCKKGKCVYINKSSICSFQC